jgi:hypothetical protein
MPVGLLLNGTLFYLPINSGEVAMRYEFPTLPSVRYLAMATDLKPWIWLAVAGAAIVIGFIFDLKTSVIMSLIVVIIMAAVADSMIMNKIDGRQTQAKFDQLMNSVLCSRAVIEQALMVIKDENERFIILEPLLNLLTNPIYTIEERRDWILQLPPLTRDCVDRYCQNKLKEQQRIYASPKTTPLGVDQAEDAICELEELIASLARKAQ